MSRQIVRRKLLLGLALLPLAGCQSGLTAQQREWLRRGSEFYDRQQYTSAIGELDQFLREAPQQPETARALYLRGLSYAQIGRRTAAYNDLRRAAAVGGRSDAVWRSHVVLGTLHFEDGNWRQAAESLRAAARSMPNAPPKDTVLYRLGLCLERIGDWEAARQPYREIVLHFGGGNYADAARRRLALNARHFSVQVGAFSQKQNADNLVLNLRRQGLQPFIRTERRGHRTLHVVLVGRYPTLEEARRQHAMIKREFVPDAILWP